jgi:hypothetical protein
VIDGKVLLESIEWNISKHEYVHYELEFDLNNPHFLSERKDLESNGSKHF